MVEKLIHQLNKDSDLYIGVQCGTDVVVVNIETGTKTTFDLTKEVIYFKKFVLDAVKGK